MMITFYGDSNSLAQTMSDFEGGGTNITLEQFGEGPAPTIVTGAGGNPGSYLQLTLPENSSHNWATFDHTNDPGDFDGFATSDFSFDFNIAPGAGGGSADGFTFAYADTSIYGETGGVTAAPFTAETPAAAGILGFSFDTYGNGAPWDAAGGDDYSDISLFWSGSLVDRVYDTRDPNVLDPPLTLDDGAWHNVEGSVDFLNKTVNLSVDGNPIWTDLAVPNLVPLESRVMLAGRTGGLNEDLRIDNVNVDWSTPANAPPAGEQPAPTEGNWSVREWRAPFEVTGIAAADMVINDPEFQTERYVYDGMADTVNFADPQSPGGGIIPNVGRLAKQPFLSNTAGDDNDIVMRATSRVVIPEDGQYTFGFNSDDGARLTLDGADFMLQATTPNAEGDVGTASGEVIEYAAPTGSSLTLASTFLTAGEHDLEVVYFERGGGAFVEVFASPGVDDEVNLGADGFAPVGRTEELVVAQGTLPTTVGEWNVRTVDVVPEFESTAVDDMGNPLMGLQNLEDAERAVELAENDPFHPDIDLAFDAQTELVNFNDPDTNGTGSGRFTPDDPFPLEEQGVDDNDFAILATTTVSITEENDYIFGFASDDGGALTLEGADFTILSTAGGLGEVTNDGQTLEYDVLTGNSDTFGWTRLTPGEYDLEFLMWERGGGAFAEVFTGVGSELESIITARLLGSAAETFDLVIPAGLALAGEGPGPGIEGDFNNNGLVEQQDLDLVLGNWGQDAANPPANWTNDLPEGNIDQTELDKVLANWGDTAALGNGAAVPEPSSLGLLLIVAGLGFGLWRKHR